MANGGESTILTLVPAPRIASAPSARGGGRVPALIRTATVLQSICDAGRPMPLAELTQVTGFPKSSVMGICHALTEEHVLVRGVDGTYALGSRVFEFGSAARAHSRPLHDIGFSYPVDESFFLAEIRTVRAEATRLGANLDLRCAKEDKERQSQQIREFVSADVDLILVEPVVSEGLEAACAAAHTARIPVVAIGSAVSGADAVVATDNTKAGSLAGAALAKALAGQGRIAVVGGIFLLLGHGWARWLLLAWLALHVVVSTFHSVSETLAHVVLLMVVSYFLLGSGASKYFKSKPSE